MFVKLKSKQGQHPGYNISRGGELPQFKEIRSNCFPSFGAERSVSPTKRQQNKWTLDALEIINQEKSSQFKKTRETSEKIKRTMNGESSLFENTPSTSHSKNYSTSTMNSSGRFRLPPPSGFMRDSRVSHSLEAQTRASGSESLETSGMLMTKSRFVPLGNEVDGRISPQNRGFRGRRLESMENDQPEYRSKGFKLVDPNEMVLKTRTEQYSENVFDTLAEPTQRLLTRLCRRRLFDQKANEHRVHNFTKMVVNGLYISKFVNPSSNLYTPSKMLLPKSEVLLSNQNRKERFLFIEPMYTLVVANPSYIPNIEEPEYYLRPKAKEFLATAAEKWEVILYSSRKADQVERIANLLDPLKCFVKFSLDRRHCTITSRKKCLKSLDIIQNIDKEKCLILEYKPQNVATSLNQAIIAMHWDGSTEDQELIPGLTEYLDRLATSPNMLETNKNRNEFDAILSSIYKVPNPAEFSGEKQIQRAPSRKLSRNNSRNEPPLEKKDKPKSKPRDSSKGIKVSKKPKKETK